MGGGDRPPEAMARFVAWAGGASARILVLPWASAEPTESCDAIVAELEPHGPAEAVCGAHATLDAKGKAAPLDEAKKAATLAQLATASGVFFTGGDQARIMDVLADPALLAAVKARFAAGRHAEVVGRGPVVLVDAVGPDRLEVRILRSGAKKPGTCRRGATTPSRGTRSTKA